MNAHQTAEREREQREREREQNRDRERTYHHDGESQHSIPSHGMNGNERSFKHLYISTVFV